MLARIGIETEVAPAGTTIAVAGNPQPLVVDPGDTETLVALVPSWRRDIAIEADIAEEVARVRGYELVPDILPDTPMPPFRPSPLRIRDSIRETLVGAGLSEAVTLALVSPAMAETFGPTPDTDVPGEGHAGGRVVTVSNPLSSQHSVMRQSVIGSLLEVVSTNRRYGTADVAIFEIGKGYAATDDGDSTHEWWRLAFALTGSAEIPAWNRPARPYDMDDAKGILELLAHELALPAPQYAPVTDDPVLHPGRSAVVQAGEGLAGRLGELHPAVVERLDLRVERVVVAEVAIAGLSGGQPAVPRAASPSRHPSVERDLAVVVADAQPAAAVETAIAAHGGPLLARVTLFDIYRGRPLDPADKSLAFRLLFGGDDRTLTEDEVDAAMAAITAGLTTDVGGRLRT